MTIKLSPRTKLLVEKRAKAGGYASLEDVIVAGLGALEQQEALADFAPKLLDALIAEGEESGERDGAISLEASFKQRRLRRSR